MKKIKNIQNYYSINLKVMFSYIAFLALNIIYYLYFTVNYEAINAFSDGNSLGTIGCNMCWGNFSYVLNGDSLKAYFPMLQELIEYDRLKVYCTSYTDDLCYLTRHHSISYFFYAIWIVFPYEFENIIFVAFIVNNVFIILSYIFFVKVGREVLGLNMRLRWLYFLNPTLIFISQLINKEVFILAAVTILAYYALNRKIFFRRKLIPLILPLLILFIVRLPFIILVSILALYKRNKIQINRVILVFLGLGLMGGIYYSGMEYALNKELVRSSGVTLNAFKFNTYYLGPLLFSLIKIMANFYDLIVNAFHSLRLYDVIGELPKQEIDLYHATTIPIVIAILIKLKTILYIIFHPLRCLRSNNGGLIALVLIFLVIVSHNIYIHSRYLWPILPLMVLMLSGVQMSRRMNKI